MNLCTFPPLHCLLNLEADFSEVRYMSREVSEAGEVPINFVNVGVGCLSWSLPFSLAVLSGWPPLAG